jgi:DeoR family transcriptional regulator of aga operon/DeoR family fructose operon transcriptional repressor
VARALRGRRDLTVITNGIRVAEELAKIPATNIIMPGGTFRREIFSLVGGGCEELLKPLNVRRAFLGAKGFTLTEGLTDVNRDEVVTRRTFVHAANEVIAILDHTKWGHVALASICAPTQLHAIITDRQAPPDLVEAARAQGIQVRLV